MEGVCRRCGSVIELSQEWDWQGVVINTSVFCGDKTKRQSKKERS
jgi:hypothetical protein